MDNTSFIVETEENKNSFEIKIWYCFQYCEGLYKAAKLDFFFFFLMT